MTRLLVSVRNATEALTALAAGADLVDVKEPDRGALGAADADTISKVVAAVAQRVPTSAALGELAEFGRREQALPRQLNFVKWGPAGCANLVEWLQRWRAASAGLPEGTQPVAVAYADSQAAGSPDPWQIADQAMKLGCRGLLLDTYNKRNGSVLEYFSLADLQRWMEPLQDAGILTVVAGGLGANEVSQIARIRPDYIGVRGAACEGGRAGVIDHRRICTLRHFVCESSDRSPAATERA